MTTDQGAGGAPSKMRLRYNGRCAACGSPVPARSEAWYDRVTKGVWCAKCGPGQAVRRREPAQDASQSEAPGPLGPTAGGAPERPSAGATPSDHPNRPGGAPAGTPNPPGAAHGRLIPPGAAPAGTANAPGTADGVVNPPGAPSPAAVPPVTSAGVAGASARREYERRTQKDLAAREANRTRVRAQHPRLGGLILALSEDRRERSSTKVWEQGAEGEEAIGSRLDAWAASAQCYVLHDRRIPRSRANIDHIAIAPSGIWAIDAKHYAGSVEHVDKGGWFSSDLRVMVGRRDKTHLVDGVLRQVQHLRAALESVPGGDQVPVQGMLCFVGADWALFARPFTHNGAHICWPAEMVKLLNRPGPLPQAQRAELFEALGRRMRQA